jgi:IS1 family transposase
MALYRKVKRLRPNISHIYTDANSCYDSVFSTMKIPEKHIMTKAETHLIESSNSSIRDNLTRFNRKTKRISKTLTMLHIFLDLFFHRFLFALQ